MQTPRLRYWREYQAMTLRELAAKAGVAYRTVWRLENGFPAEPPTVRKLAEALGIHPAELQGLVEQGASPVTAPGQQKAAA